MEHTKPKLITMSCNDLKIQEELNWDCDAYELLNIFKKFLYSLSFSDALIEKVLNEYETEEFYNQLYSV